MKSENLTRNKNLLEMSLNIYPYIFSIIIICLFCFSILYSNESVGQSSSDPWPFLTVSKQYDKVVNELEKIHDILNQREIQTRNQFETDILNKSEIQTESQPETDISNRSEIQTGSQPEANLAIIDIATPVCAPKKLVGELKIEFPEFIRQAKWEDLNAKFKPIFVNGSYTPSDCHVPPLRRVAIIIPFRDNPQETRFHQLQWMMIYMVNILTRQNIQFGFYFITQGGDKKNPFNRGKLMNIGFDKGWIELGRCKLEYSHGAAACFLVCSIGIITLELLWSKQEKPQFCRVSVLGCCTLDINMG